MTNEELIDLANELKSDETTNPIGIFEEFAKENNISQEELEQLLSKNFLTFMSFEIFDKIFTRLL